MLESWTPISVLVCVMLGIVAAPAMMAIGFWFANRLAELEMKLSKKK